MKRILFTMFLLVCMAGSGYAANIDTTGAAQTPADGTKLYGQSSGGTKGYITGSGLKGYLIDDTATNGDTTKIWSADKTFDQLALKEPALGNPGTTGYVLSSTDAGVRSWVAQSGGSGYTNLTSFIAQTPWRLFYSNTDGDVIELALGADGTYLKSNGAAAAPTFATPAGTGDLVSTNNLSDLTNATTARTNLGLVAGTADLVLNTLEVGEVTTSALDGARDALLPPNTTYAVTAGETGFVNVGSILYQFLSGAAIQKIVGVIASGTAALGTAEIANGACATAVTETATGTAATDVINWGFNGDPTAVNGYNPLSDLLYIVAYPTANNVNFKVCNKSGSPVTPGAITLNWSVQR